MPYAIAIKEDNYLYKIVKVLDTPACDLEVANMCRQSYAKEHKIPITNLIIVYSD